MTEKHVYISTPSGSGKPVAAYFKSLAETEALLSDRGWRASYDLHCGDIYIQSARNHMLARFADSGASHNFMIDDDISWKAEDFLAILEMPEDFVFATYRLKNEDMSEDYPIGVHCDGFGRPIVSKNGLLPCSVGPTGFMRITAQVVEDLMDAYPNQRYTQWDRLGIKAIRLHDMFPQGARGGKWWGEDAAFCNLYSGLIKQIWCAPNITLTHHDRQNGKEYVGNYHEYLLRLSREQAAAKAVA